MAEQTVRLHHQLATGIGMTAIAALLLLLWPAAPGALTGTLGLPVAVQLALGLGLGALYWLAALLDYRRHAGSERVRRTVESYRQLDLAGWNPFWIALGAGIGEELLFRGALQPHLGVWLTSALFALAHAKVYDMARLDRTTLIQATTLFAVSAVLGWLAHYTGLLTAIAVHTLVDVAGLLLVRRAAATV
ncbi:hypothetical protein IP92_04243 [Pseudoduganella flava]|uniref:CPBP family intramembrane metalloprotease n=1 Tax=Pseudoduganella flava TaxID=871742 RepID=A0A562PIT5_9BURK|nr:CPBP family intramembrane glutamic endopeptidase [Pseudoduganella flava]QGZ41893.1 CPBP family intramembrane metalloprotease [Pseudoduganella flava]TWI44298.1 hypothetical protein IP92_04243 [Pseudoduganella flava]